MKISWSYCTQKIRSMNMWLVGWTLEGTHEASWVSLYKSFSCPLCNLTWKIFRICQINTSIYIDIDTVGSTKVLYLLTEHFYIWKVLFIWNVPLGPGGSVARQLWHCNLAVRHRLGWLLIIQQVIRHIGIKTRLTQHVTMRVEWLGTG